MNRLEEIKKYKLDRYKYYDTISGQEYEDDVSYLIQRLEIAHKALESANNKLGQISSKDFANGQLRYEAAKIIQEALHEIT